jgi:hypothetical protein
MRQSQEYEIAFFLKGFFRCNKGFCRKIIPQMGVNMPDRLTGSTSGNSPFQCGLRVPCNKSQELTSCHSIRTPDYRFEH